MSTFQACVPLKYSVHDLTKATKEIHFLKGFENQFPLESMLIDSACSETRQSVFYEAYVSVSNLSVDIDLQNELNLTITYADDDDD